MRPSQVFFNYNGHSWEAFETLGIQATEDLAEAKSAYQKMRKKLGKEAEPFLQDALRAIEISLQKKSTLPRRDDT